MPKNDVNMAHKDVAVDFLNLVGSGRPKDGLHFFASECKTHNPYVPGGMNELIDAMIAVQKQGAEGISKDQKLTSNSLSGRSLLTKTWLQSILNSQAPNQVEED